MLPRSLSAAVVERLIFRASTKRNQRGQRPRLHSRPDLAVVEMSAIVQISVASCALRHTSSSNTGDGVAMTIILDEQAKCVQCGNLHFVIVSFPDPHETLSCLECGYGWNVNQ